MDLLSTLRRSGGIDAIARQTGENPAVVTDAAQLLLPAFLGCLGRFVAQAGGGGAGIDSLVTLFDGLGNSNLAAMVMGPETASRDPGHEILQRVCARDDAIDVILGAVVLPAGLARDRAGEILKLLAMLVGGYISAIAEGNAMLASGEEQGLAQLIALFDSQA